ncbi:vegetative cell wall protein gp1-like [Triticum urartu]|uniref:vegetative cell wall protein gp1-like n=1 Tax=Triticum urartu TaxID=4572 RepID=UPI002044B3F6|nr:vegetative cell wall protein gp1-like [Triticum urartu]
MAPPHCHTRPNPIPSLPRTPHPHEPDSLPCLSPLAWIRIGEEPNPAPPRAPDGAHPHRRRGSPPRRAGPRHRITTVVPDSSSPDAARHLPDCPAAARNPPPPPPSPDRLPAKRLPVLGLLTNDAPTPTPFAVAATSPCLRVPPASGLPFNADPETDVAPMIDYVVDDPPCQSNQMTDPRSQTSPLMITTTPRVPTTT